MSDPAQPAGDNAPRAAEAAPAAGPAAGPTTGGGPAGYAPPPGYPGSVGYAPPTGYAPPPGYAPAGGYAAPPGYAAPIGYAGPYGSPAPAGAAAPRTLGRVALLLSLVAAVGASLLGAIAAFHVGRGGARQIATRAFDGGFDWSLLTPVRDWVLVGELAFWAGTVIGVWALVQGIVAIVTRRGRAAAIAAVIIAALGPVVFFGVVQAMLAAGAGAALGG